MRQLSQERLCSLCWKYLLLQLSTKTEVSSLQLQNQFQTFLEPNTSTDEQVRECIEVFCDDLSQALRAFPHTSKGVRMEKDLRNTVAFIYCIYMMQREHNWWKIGPAREAVTHFADAAQVTHGEAFQFFSQMSLIILRF